MLSTYGIAGGIFAWFVLTHFGVDFLAQSHTEAIQKSSNGWVRARHCLIYSIGFIPVLWLFGLSLTKAIIALNILFWSHWLEDTYLLVLYWTKYVRRPPAFKGLNDKLTWRISDDDKRAFRAFIQEPLGTILMIAADQIVHLACLIPVVYLTVAR
jgi:hypothetical protein